MFGCDEINYYKSKLVAFITTFKKKDIRLMIDRMKLLPISFQFKTRCLVMMKSMKSCKREIKALSNIQATVSTTCKILVFSLLYIYSQALRLGF